MKNNLESILVRKIGGEGRVIWQKKPDQPVSGASLSKLVYALEVMRRIEEGEIDDELISIERKQVANYGTDVLMEMMENGDRVDLSPKTLVGLMLKYSCNSATDILLRECLSSHKNLQREARRRWGLKIFKLVDKEGEIKNRINMEDLYKIYKVIFGDDKRLSTQSKNLLKGKLKRSRNIYYLFDQLEVEVMGSKSGTYLDEQGYWIGDSGVMRSRNEDYFWGAMVRREKISQAVERIRRIGEEAKKKVESEI